MSEYSAEAAKFKGSSGWLQRFKRRKGIVTRKKTNVKNTPREKTEPVLQHYFRAFRRRLRDTEWRRARATSSPPLPVEPPTDGAAGAAARVADRAAWDAEAAAEAAAVSLPAAISALVPRAIATVVFAAPPSSTEPPATAAVVQRRKWGKYLPYQRFNVDQVPMPFINVEGVAPALLLQRTGSRLQARLADVG